MSSPRRVAAAYAISVLLHLIILLVLALMPDIQVTADAAQDAETAPLEIALQTEPAATPAPPTLAEAAPPTPTPVPTPKPQPAALTEVKPLKAELRTLVPAAEVIRTQMDPANLKRAEKAPENPTFIASHNSVATKPKPRPLAAGSNPGPSAVPTASGRSPKPADREVAAMEQALLKQAGISPAQTPEPVALPKPTPLPHPAATAPFFRTSLPRPTPLPVATPSPKPPGMLAAATPSPAPSPKRQEQVPTPAPSVSGSGSGLAGETPAGQSGNDDEVGVDAIGKWTKGVGNAVGSCWNFYRQSKMDLMAVGEVRIKFLIDAKGHVSEVSIVSNTGNPTNAMYAVRSVREAEFPPIPPERLARLPNGCVTLYLTFTILPTQ